jgi:hypothetical protein
LFHPLLRVDSIHLDVLDVIHALRCVINSSHYQWQFNGFKLPSDGLALHNELTIFDVNCS